MAGAVAVLGNLRPDERCVDGDRLTDVSRGPLWLLPLQRLILRLTLADDRGFCPLAQRIVADTPWSDALSN
jgi:hypothetical protein